MGVDVHGDLVGVNYAGELKKKGNRSWRWIIVQL